MSFANTNTIEHAYATAAGERERVGESDSREKDRAEQSKK